MKKNIYIPLLISLLSFQACSLKNDSILFNKTELLKEKKEVIESKEIKEEKQNQTNIQNTSLTHDNIKFEYKIVPHDRISLLLYRHPDLSTTNQPNGILVDSEGVISLPLVEDIKISGLTQKNAALKIQEAYENYLNYSKVRLEVLNKRAYIIGEVKKPGPFSLANEQTTLLQAIAISGDFTSTADRKRILIIRAEQNTAKTSIVDLTDENSLLYARLMIQPNDIIYVLPNKMKAINSNISSISPIFQLISNILSPFVSLTYLKNN